MPVEMDWSDSAKVVAAVKENLHVLKQAPAEFWENREVVLAAVQQDGAALWYASPAPLGRDFSLAAAEILHSEDGQKVLFGDESIFGEKEPGWLGDEARAEQLAEIVRADPWVADIRDRDGRLAINIALPKCKEAMEAALRLFGAFDVDSGPPLHISRTACVLAATCHKEGGAEPTTRVALKGMRELNQVLAELNGREGLDARYR